MAHGQGRQSWLSAALLRDEWLDFVVDLHFLFDDKNIRCGLLVESAALEGHADVSFGWLCRCFIVIIVMIVAEQLLSKEGRVNSRN